MFNIDNSVSASSSSVNRLAGNEIHKVVFRGAESTELKDGEFQVIQFKFDNESGEHTHTIFEPKSEDFTRKASGFEGGGENPSGVEQMYGFIRHLIKAINPDLDKKIEAGTQKLGAPTWDKLRQVIVAATNKGIGKEVEIKLLLNKKGNASFPSYPLGMSKAGSPYLKSNFIGENLQFTEGDKKEMAKIAAVLASQPTNMSSGGSSAGKINLPTEDEVSDDLNFEIDDL